MVVAWHDAAFTMPDAILTPEIMRKILHKFHLQHKLKQTWTREESLLFEKMLFLEEDMVGSVKPEANKKSEEMMKEQDRLTKEIEEERLKLKAMRD